MMKPSEDTPRSTDRPPRGLGAVILFSADPKALASWYATRLGIATERADDGGYYGTLIRRSGERQPFGIFPLDRAAWPTQGGVMVNYIFDDLDAAIAGNLRGEDIKRETSPDWPTEEFGRFAYTRDPDGNILELWEPPGRDGKEDADRH